MTTCQPFYLRKIAHLMRMVLFGLTYLLGAG